MENQNPIIKAIDEWSLKTQPHKNECEACISLLKIERKRELNYRTVYIFPLIPNNSEGEKYIQNLLNESVEAIKTIDFYLQQLQVKLDRINSAEKNVRGIFSIPPEMN